jgi:hypothetical protein
VIGLLRSPYVIIGAVIGAGLLLWAYTAKVRRDVIAEIEVKAAKAAIERVLELEKNNAAFSKLGARERCLVFMRDSGLPDSNCD